MTYPSATEVMHKALQAELIRLLEKCTFEQQVFFERMCPDYETLYTAESDVQLRAAYALIVRTLVSNEAPRNVVGDEFINKIVEIKLQENSERF